MAEKNKKKENKEKRNLERSIYDLDTKVLKDDNIFHKNKPTGVEGEV